jgi:hypothetical protein
MGVSFKVLPPQQRLTNGRDRQQVTAIRTAPIRILSANYATVPLPGDRPAT